MKKDFYHDRGIIYDEGRPRALTYNLEAEIEAEITPFEEHAIIEVETQDGTPMNYFLPVTQLSYWVEDSNWSPESPLHASYKVNTDIAKINEMDLLEPEPLKEFVNEHFDNPSSVSPREAARWLSEEFEYVRNSTFHRDDFLAKREGQCDQFAEIMSVFNPNWIKHQGFARQGDSNLPSEEIEFGDHAWVVDTQNEVIYDPAPLISNDKNPEWIERNTDVYFPQLPRLEIKQDGEIIPEKINKPQETIKNYEIDYDIQVDQ